MPRHATALLYGLAAAHAWGPLHGPACVAPRRAGCVMQAKNGFEAFVSSLAEGFEKAGKAVEQRYARADLALSCSSGPSTVAHPVGRCPAMSCL